MNKKEILEIGNIKNNLVIKAIEKNFVIESEGEINIVTENNTKKIYINYPSLRNNKVERRIRKLLKKRKEEDINNIIKKGGI